VGSSELTVTVLGCDGSYPGPEGGTSGYLVRAGETRVWLDAGTGTLAQLQRYVPIEQVDAVVLSHQHADHWSDIEHFAVACRYVLGRTGVPVYAPEGLESLTRVGAANEALDWSAIADGSRIEIGSLTFSFSQTDHPVTTLAARIEGAGRRLGYSADSGPAWSLVSLGRDLDLAICEATFLTDQEGIIQHLSARQAGESGREAGVGRLVITHLWPRLDRDAARQEAEAAFGGAVTVAAVGDRYVV
jgi:ribonuclease BN (tRNA processing enzyme)